MIALGFVKARNPSGPAKDDKNTLVRKRENDRGLSTLTKSSVAASLGPTEGQILVQLNPQDVGSRTRYTKNEETYVENTKVVNRDHSTFELLRDLDSIGLIGSKNASSKPIFRSISEVDGLLHIFVTLNHGDRSEHYHKKGNLVSTLFQNSKRNQRTFQLGDKRFSWRVTDDSGVEVGA